MKKILLIASEYAPGMLSFASSIINRLSESGELIFMQLLYQKENLNMNLYSVKKRKRKQYL